MMNLGTLLVYVWNKNMESDPLFVFIKFHHISREIPAKTEW